MVFRDNYALLADQTRRLFLTYDQSAILSNIPLPSDPDFFYLQVLDRTCRIDRHTGFLDWSSPDGWKRSTDHADPITIFDYLCDAKHNRTRSGQFTTLTSLGNTVHSSLNENRPASLLEQFIDCNPDLFRRACMTVGGTPHSQGDIGFILPLFPDFPVLLQFWHSDEDFPPQLRTYWDANTLQWIRYETAYYAQSMIIKRLADLMDFHQTDVHL